DANVTRDIVFRHCKPYPNLMWGHAIRKDRNFDSRPQGGEASEGSRKGRGAAPPPGRRLTDRPGAVCGRHSSTVRRISARRAIAETCLRPVACAGALASAQALEGIRV